MHKVVLTFILFSVLSVSSGYAQERIGLTYGQYNGINAAQLNTSYLLKTPHNWELQLVGFHTFFDTNYGYIKSSSLLHSLQNGDLINVPEFAYDDVLDAQPLDVVFNSKSKKTYVDGKADVLGIGGFYKLNSSLVIGLSTKARSALTSYDIPSSLNYFNAKQLPGDILFELNEFQLNALAWTEYGLHLATSLSNKIDVGASIKYNNGYTSLSFDNNVNIDYIEQSDTLSALESGQSRLAFPVHDGDQPQVVGSGLSFDIGVNYKNDDGSSVGFSIIDLGWVGMTGKNYLINFEEGQSIVYGDYKGIKEIDQQISQMITDGFDIDSTQNYSLQLPSAISLQYQKNFTANLGIQGHWIQRLDLSDLQIKRSNSVTVSGTYDKRHFSAFLPISMYNYSHVRVGAAIRIAFLTIGSDKIFSLFGENDKFSGADFYINLKYYPFKIGGSKKDDVNCFAF